MVVERVIDIPVSRRLKSKAPRTVPAGRAITTFTSATVGAAGSGASQSDDAQARRMIAELKRRELPRPRTIEEAIQQAEHEAARPGRTPISCYFGVMKDSPLTQTGVEYQRSIRDEWD